MLNLKCRHILRWCIVVSVGCAAVLRDVISQEEFAGVHLVIAGGYDELVSENCVYLGELRHVAAQLAVTSHVTFLCNVTAAEKRQLLRTSTCLLYTPDREHFGIVPVEAMHARCPVIAVNSGGPCETIVDGVTGFLRPAAAAEFAAAMRKFIGDEGAELRRELGEAGSQHVQQRFSFDSFTVKLDGIVRALCSSSRQ